MTDRSATKLALWPFILVDVLFLALAYLIFSHAHRPLNATEMFALIVCAAIGAWSFLTPFLRRNSVEVKLAEADNLATTVAQIQNLDQIAAQLSSSSNYLGTALEQSVQTVTKAKEIAEKMTEESHGFATFIQQANDSEKAHLRLEVEKLRRSEVDWIQVLVAVLDQIFALHQAALRSGKLPLIEQLGNFQIICRDAARRVGLVCSAAEPDQTFDEKLHGLIEGETISGDAAKISETLAPGYSYQGQVVRRALVRLKSENSLENLNTPEIATTAEDKSEVTAQKSFF